MNKPPGVMMRMFCDPRMIRAAKQIGVFDGDTLYETADLRMLKDLDEKRAGLYARFDVSTAQMWLYTEPLVGQKSHWHRLVNRLNLRSFPGVHEDAVRNRGHTSGSYDHSNEISWVTNYFASKHVLLEGGELFIRTNTFFSHASLVGVRWSMTDEGIEQYIRESGLIDRELGNHVLHEIKDYRDTGLLTVSISANEGKGILAVNIKNPDE